MDTGGMDLETSSTEEDTEKSFLPESFEFSAELRHFISSSGKHPVSLFTELHRSVFKTDPKPYCRGVPSEDPNKCNFICSVFVGTDQITGSALSRKKSARFDCFYRALQVLFDKYLYQSVCAPFNIKFHESSTIHELIRQLTYSKYSNLVKENQNIMDADKVVASVFLFNAADRSLNIVSLATGNKCIRGDCLSLLGESLNDCHAEIIARRGLLRFLYAQIISYLRCPDKSIFTRHESGKLVLRPSLTFHLFINTAPCGDARVYDRMGSAGSMKEASDDNDNAGKMRFKVENGMGTVLGEGDYGPQTVDGILGGERLRTMSCSDKIMRWNFLGVQGGLLSRFLLPIYLSSVSIGDAQDSDRLQRALSGRLGDLSPLPPYAQNTPLVGLCQTDMFTRKCDRNLNTSINWNASDNSVETVNTITGKTPPGGTSRLSRKILAELFQELCSEEGKPVPAGYSYKKIKVHSTQYMDAQKQFLKWLEVKNLGQWHKKPVESSNFII